MVQEVRDASKGLSTENSILVRMGAKMPPEPYAGEPDLKQYQVFVAGLLRWFSMNQLLGSDAESTLMQLKCLGNCLQGNAQEWYVRNIESWDRTVQTWTLESTLEGLQKQFLHALTHRQASISYETTHQGGGTVQDLLNKLTKFVVRMVKKHDLYTQRKRFLVALRDLLHREVLSHGYTAEFSRIEDLISTAQPVEDAMRYDLGTRHMEGYGGGHIPLQWLAPAGVRPNLFPRPVQAQQARPREMVNQGPPYQTQTKSSAPKAAEQHSAANPLCPAGARHNPSTAPNQAGPICFRCGKAGHLGHDCKQGKPRAAVARLAEDEEGVPEGDHLEEEDQEEAPPVNGVEQDDARLEGGQYLDMLVEDDVTSRALGYPTHRLGLVVPESRDVWTEASACALRWPSVVVQVF